MKTTKTVVVTYQCNWCKKVADSLPPDPLHGTHYMPPEWIEATRAGFSGIDTHFCSEACQADSKEYKEEGIRKAKQRIIEDKLYRLEEVKDILTDIYNKLDKDELEVSHLLAGEEMIHKALWNVIECRDNCSQWDED